MKQASLIGSVLGLGLAVALVGWGETAHADDPSVDEIIEKTNFMTYCQGTSGRGRMAMTIVDGQGRKQKREFSMLRLNNPTPKSVPKSKRETYCNKQRFYVYFHKPADVNKTSFLVWKNPGKDDDRWLYLPALDVVKRIAAGDKRTSFVGSHFFYEDISGRHMKADKHKLVQTTDNYYVIKNTPKKAKEVEFKYYKIWIHRDTFLVVKAEFYDKKGKKYREFVAEEVKKIDGYPTVIKQTMSDLRTGGSTTIQIKKAEYDVGLSSSVFSERYLRKPPKKHFR